MAKSIDELNKAVEATDFPLDSNAGLIAAFSWLCSRIDAISSPDPDPAPPRLSTQTKQ